MDFSEIKQVQGFDGQYVKEYTAKNQIVLHHTVSGDGAEGDLNWWKQTKQRIATAIIIERDGDIYQCFSTKFWGYHIGPVLPSFERFGMRYRKCDPSTIGVELDSWGPLLKQGNGYYPVKWNAAEARYEPWYAAGEVSADQVVEYERPFRGFRYFEKYRSEQLKSLKDLLQYWNKYWGIPLAYNKDMWELNRDALAGVPGVYAHVSFRQDKSDAHPQDELIEMLKSLSNG